VLLAPHQGDTEVGQKWNNTTTSVGLHVAFYLVYPARHALATSVES